MEQIVIVAYRAHPGKEERLAELLKKHVSVLRSEGLATERPPLFLTSEDGAFVEIFGWVSQAAIDAAHTNPSVQALWGEFAETCEYEVLSNVAPAQRLFSQFTPLDPL